MALCLSMLAIVLIYKDIESSMTQLNESSIGLNYIITKVRENNKNQVISIQNLGDTNALVITDSQKCRDILYFFDESLMEIMVEENDELDLYGGELIAECKSGSFKIENNLLYIILVDNDNNQQELHLSLIGEY